jgi:hypothetical protein
MWMFVELSGGWQSLRLLWMGLVALDVLVLNIQSLLLPRGKAQGSVQEPLNLECHLS